MKFIISRLEFSDLLNRLQSLVPSKTNPPILSHCLVEVANNELVLSVTDNYVAVRCYTDVKVIQEGSVTIPVKKAALLVKELSSVNLEIASTEGHKVEILADSSRFKFHGFGKEEFPDLPDFEGASRFTVKQHTLKEMLYRTAFSVSREETRYVLTGVYMNIANGVATFVGTDGKRLSLSRVELEDIDKEFVGSYTIPIKAVDEIMRNLTDDVDEMSTLYLMADRIAVESSHITVIAKLLSGEYPDYDAVIPSRSELSVGLHAQELTSLLKQMSLFTENPTHSVRFSLSEGSLQVDVNSAQLGEGKVSMPANYQGPKLDIAFNPGYFLDILRHCKNEVITLSVSDSYTPGVITDRDQPTLEVEGQSPIFVLMPMRLYEE